MSDQYVRDILRLAVTQICQTIGYSATQTTPLILLQDVMHKFLKEFTSELRRNIEHYNRTEATLNDALLVFNNININTNDLLDYVNSVDIVSPAVDVSLLPAVKSLSLNFLKPGSKEVLTRPIHIYEYLPTVLTTDLKGLYSAPPCLVNENTNDNLYPSRCSLDSRGEETNSIEVAHIKKQNALNRTDSITQKKTPSDASHSRKSLIIENLTPISNPVLDEEGRPTREISSVVMTSGGFISPSIEGKLPESIIPDFIGIEVLDLKSPIEYVKSPDIKNSINRSTDIKNKNVRKLQENVESITGKSKNKDEIYSASSFEELYLRDYLKNRKSDTNSENLFNSQLAPYINSNPIMASKLLKKAKKKSTNTIYALQNKLSHANSGVIKKGNVKDNNTTKKSKLERKFARRNKVTKNSNQFAGLGNIPETEKLQREKILKKQMKLSKKGIRQLSPRDVQSNMIFKNVQYDEQSQLTDKTLYNIQKTDSAEVIIKNLPKITETSLSTTPFKSKESNDVNFCLVENTRDLKAKDGEPDYTGLRNSKINFREVKLPTELDRNKSSIFKKISKQKHGKQASQITNKATESLYDSCNGQIINLPSGTTITPAPQQLNSLNNSVTGNTSVELFSSADRSIFQLSPSKFPISPGHTGSEQQRLESIKNKSERNKPKKRGRKPGSKYNSKAVDINKTINTTEKINELERDKNFFDSKNQLLGKLDPEPLNLFKHNKEVVGLDFVLNNSVNNIDVPLVQPTVKLRKERKKLKSKCSKPTFNVVSKDNLRSFGTESASSLNNNLFHMETEAHPMLNFQSISQLKNATDNPNHQGDLNKDFLLLPTKRTDSAKQLIPPNSSPLRDMLNSSVSSFMSSTGTGLLSMLPMYPFPTQPSLIPSTALFPTPGLSKCSNNGPNVDGRTYILPRFLPYSNLKAKSNNEGLQMQDIDKKNQHDGQYPDSNFSANYSNVLPLVPERVTSIKPDFNMETEFYVGNSQKSISIEQISNNKASSISKNINDRTILNHSLPSNMDIESDALAKKNSGRLCQSSMVISQDNDTLLSKSVEIDKKLSTINNKVQQKNGHEHILNDPIEVSDDSNEAKTSEYAIKSSGLIKTKSKMVLPLVKSKLIVPEFPSKNEDTVKSRKSQKPSRRESFPCALASKNPFDLIIGERSGVGKLAGGADLIPLAGTGLSYSSKSIPNTSLTGAPGSITPLASEYESQRNINSLTISNTSTNLDLQKKRKEQKKLKKLKEGKIKKKKDRKKQKNKDLVEKEIEIEADPTNNTESIYKSTDKHLFKKIKKEKRKSKQRSTNISSSTITSTYSDNKSTSKLNSESLNVKAKSPTISVVPKLTLKLGNSPTSSAPSSSHNTLNCATQAIYADSFTKDTEKRDSSPELARISPLVTRPPKTKMSSREINISASNISSESLNENSKSSSSTAQTFNSIFPPPSPWLSGGTLTASSVLLPQQLLQAKKTNDQISLNPAEMGSINLQQTCKSSFVDQEPIRNNPVPLIAESGRPSSYIDAEGNRVWICPACGKVDDGSAMIGCDGCDAWYHWVCVGIFVAPKDNEDWFCRVCITKKKTFPTSDKKRKRTKKKQN